MPRIVRQVRESQARGFGERSRPLWFDPAFPLVVMAAVAEAERAGVLGDPVGAS